ncbi:DUF2857 domain-containing protein [Muribacter muris]|uniref:DUF2857 domain-containing protein n=1 Tax=Muribacter muris TaxID=67855 RepID=A0A4Y9JND7_9PAST|nr:DUF2857 domain-containing protein [Muribacter muris]MBF0786279.1 DUF2857 domain-containing protein [Muribacter muris]MBF0826775.1 DUF2857 domain-containing protein [Muribacter muris]TFV07221.1 DUF2857 domain-containing protein [Muribacter muris]
MLDNLNKVILDHIVNNIREGNVNTCHHLGFSTAELSEIQRLSIDEIYDIAQSKVPIAAISIDHSAFWKMVKVAQVNSQERMIIDRALLLGIREEPGRKATATDEQKTELWELWCKHKGSIQSLESMEGLELLMLFAEETQINLTAIWRAVEPWYRNKK